MKRQVEIIKSSRGKIMLKVNNFRFFQDRQAREGVIFWRCVRQHCSAKFCTDGQFEITSHEINSFEHNHVQSRTKLVKQLVVQEIKKVIGLKGETISTTDLKKHALTFVDQAFGKTLTDLELTNVKKSVHSYCQYYKTHPRIAEAFSSDLPPTKRRYHDEVYRLKVCKEVKQGLPDDIDLSPDSSDTDSGDEEEEMAEKTQENQSPEIPCSPSDSSSSGELAYNEYIGGVQHQIPVVVANAIPQVSREAPVNINTDSLYSTMPLSPFRRFTNSFDAENFIPSQALLRGGIMSSPEINHIVQAGPSVFNEPMPFLPYQAVSSSFPPTNYIQGIGNFGRLNVVSSVVEEAIPQRVSPGVDLTNQEQRPSNSSSPATENEARSNPFVQRLTPLLDSLPPERRTVIEDQIQHLVYWELRRQIEESSGQDHDQSQVQP